MVTASTCCDVNASIARHVLHSLMLLQLSCKFLIYDRHDIPLMLRSLLSPLSDRFVLTPRPELNSAQPEQDVFSPEDFARDVLVEVMRNAVERLKFAEGLNARSEVLQHCHKLRELR